jgi:hypothetical protein
MICVTIGAVPKSSRCKRNARTKEKETMVQWCFLVLIDAFLITLSD